MLQPTEPPNQGYNFYFLIFLRFHLFIFRGWGKGVRERREEEKEREREILIGYRLSEAPNQGPGQQPRQVP